MMSPGKKDVFGSHCFTYLLLFARVMGDDQAESRKWTPELQEVLHAQVEAMFLPIQVRLIQLKNSHRSEALTMVDETWRYFYTLTEVSEVHAWQRAMSATTCSNVSCNTRAHEDRSTLKKCSRCNVALYCSSQCQTE